MKNAAQGSEFNQKQSQHLQPLHLQSVSWVTTC
jgi:hypothetical protein